MYKILLILSILTFNIALEIGGTYKSSNNEVINIIQYGPLVKIIDSKGIAIAYGEVVLLAGQNLLDFFSASGQGQGIIQPNGEINLQNGTYWTNQSFSSSETEQQETNGMLIWNISDQVLNFSLQSDQTLKCYVTINDQDNQDIRHVGVYLDGIALPGGYGDNIGFFIQIKDVVAGNHNLALQFIDKRGVTAPAYFATAQCFTAAHLS